jgi:malonate-semialdehyde dehydrogenase (acetylating)/methylmalonate-semialdehyde dehydrogenase
MTGTSAKIKPSITTIGHLIHGEIVFREGIVHDVYNPSTGLVENKIQLAGQNIVLEAISSAEKAFPEWRNTPPIKRARIMFKFRDLLEKNSEEICELIGKEHGKISHDARGELQRGIENVEYACSAPEILKGEHSKNVGVSIDCWSEFHPLGIVAGITPFNFPAMVPLWMYPLAIVCGNCFILKPSEKDPSSTLYIAQLLTQAGLPDGVLNVVNGSKEAVNTIINDSRIQAVSFVGSTKIAKHIYSTSTSNGKRCQALGGAKKSRYSFTRRAY